MLPDLQTCSQARLTRDARFDGRLFIAVLTTGVYCRPICPSPTSRERNVRYFASAVAAEEAGFRPCLRCRPECSPGTPAWRGTPATVAHALRLINEGSLEDGGMETLACRLGIGSRHLRRLFLQHLGAPPIQVAQTRRLHFAKKLIDETALPMAQVAVAAGFGSVRRFNAAIRRVYRRTPTEIRGLVRQAQPEPAGEYVFRLPYRPPLDWEGLLEFFAPRAIPGVEVVEQDCYRRTIALEGSWGWLEATHQKSRSAILLRIHFPDARWLYRIVERVRRMFDLNADPGEVAAHLRGDGLLARQLARRPGVRVPGCWDGFELALRAILGQQVTVAGATTLAGRLVRALGTAVAAPGGLTHLFPGPCDFANAPLARIGLPGARAACIRALARAVVEGRISFTTVVDLHAFLERFRELPGIGAWTTQYVALRAFSDPDAFPSGDLGLLRAMSIRRPAQLEQRSKNWRPWRAYAAMLLWQSLGCQQSGPRNHDARRDGEEPHAPTHEDTPPHFASAAHLAALRSATAGRRAHCAAAAREHGLGNGR